MNKINIDELLEILPKLIRENDRVKGAIISALSGVVATHEDIVQLTKSMDNRFKTVQQTMDNRFETMQQTMDNRFGRVDRDLGDIKSILKNLQHTFGKPFEQFGRNVVVKVLQSEGMKEVTLKAKKFRDPEEFVSEGTTEVEIDGFSVDPPIIVEITSILRDKEKIETFLKKKEFLERKYNCSFRGFFVAATSEFSAEEMGDITVKLRKNKCELINL